MRVIVALTHDEESERRPSLIKFLEQQKLKDCYAIEGGCALHIKNDNVYSAVSFQGSKKSYLVDLKDGEIRKYLFNNKNTLTKRIENEYTLLLLWPLQLCC